MEAKIRDKDIAGCQEIFDNENVDRISLQCNHTLLNEAILTRDQNVISFVVRAIACENPITILNNIANADIALT